MGLEREIKTRENWILKIQRTEEGQFSLALVDNFDAPRSIKQFVFCREEVEEKIISHSLLDFLNAPSRTDFKITIVKENNEYNVVYGTSGLLGGGGGSWKRWMYGSVAVVGVGAGVVMVWTGVGALGGKVLIDTSIGLAAHVATAEEEDLTFKRCAIESGKSAAVSVAMMGVGAGVGLFSKVDKAAKVADVAGKASQVVQAAETTVQTSKWAAVATKAATVAGEGAAYVGKKTVQSAGTQIVAKGVTTICEATEKKLEGEKAYEKWRDETFSMNSIKEGCLQLAVASVVNGVVGSALDGGKAKFASKNGWCNLKLKNVAGKVLSEKTIEKLGKDNIRIVSRGLTAATQSALRAGGTTTIFEKMSAKNVEKEGEQDPTIAEKKKHNFRKKLLISMAIGVFQGIAEGVSTKAERIRRERAAKQYAAEMLKEEERFNKEIEDHPMKEELKKLKQLLENKESLQDKLEEKQIAEDLSNPKLQKEIDMLKDLIEGSEPDAEVLSGFKASLKKMIGEKQAAGLPTEEFENMLGFVESLPEQPDFKKEITTREKQIEANKALIEKFQNVEGSYVDAEEALQEFTRENSKIEHQFDNLQRAHQEKQQAIAEKLTRAVDAELREKGRLPKGFTEEEEERYLGLKNERDPHKVMDTHRQSSDFAVGTLHGSRREYYYDIDNIMEARRYQEYCVEVIRKKIQEYGTDHNKRKFLQAVEKMEPAVQQALFRLLNDFNIQLKNAPRSNSPIPESQKKAVENQFETTKQSIQEKISARPVTSREEFYRLQEEISRELDSLMNMDRATEILSSLPMQDRTFDLGDELVNNNLDRSESEEANASNEEEEERNTSGISFSKR